MVSRWTGWGFGDLDRSFSDLAQMRREMDRVFAGLERQSGQAQGNVGLYDLGSSLMVRAELPGFSEKDVDISLERSWLSIRAERKATPYEGYSVHRQERVPLRVTRSLTLPCRVDPEKVRAHLKNGVLELELEKAAEERPRQIQVQAG